MKNLFTLLLFALMGLVHTASAQNIAINTDGSLPDASAILDITSTGKGFLAPRMTTTQQNAISLPAKGLLIFNTTDNMFKVNTGTAASPFWSTLGISANNWLVTGNSGTSSASNFLGTIDNVSLRFKSNNIERMVLDSTGKVGIGTSAPASDFTISQSSGLSTAKGMRFTGNSLGGTSSGTGFSMALGYNATDNKQLWLGDADYLGNSAATFFRIASINGVSSIDAVSGDNLARRSLALGVGGDGNSAIVLGSDFNALAPSSYVWANGNMAIGNGLRSNAAPSNGLLVQGNTGIGVTSPTAVLHLKGGTVAANTAPLKLTSGINLTTPEDGAVEYNGTHFFATVGATRYQLDQQSPASFTGSLAGDVTGTQSATAVGKINGTSLAGLTTGILKNTTTTGVPSIAVAADFPTLNQNTTGTAAGLSANIAESQVTNLTTDLAAKAPLASPSLTGVPAAPTATAGTNTTQIATTAFVNAAVSAGTSTSFSGSLAGEVTGTQSATVVGNAAVIGKVLTGYTSGSGTVAATDNILQAIQKINGNDALKAPLASPTLTGVPAAPTATAGTNTTQIATTAFVNSAVSAGTSTSFSGSLAGDVTGTQSATVVGKINGTSLAVLTTGILKNTTTTGVPSIAVAGTDYLTPSGSAAALTGFPTLNQNTTGNAATVTTNANLTGEVTSVGNATTVTNAAVIAKVLTGYTSGSGIVAATDNILQAVQKINGNDALKAPLASPTLTGIPAAPTATAGTNTTQLATTAFVTSAVSSGSAASFTGSLAGDVTGTQSATVVGKINGTSLAGLTTGILKNTTTTGVPSIAVAADFPTLNQNTTGTAANVTGTVAVTNGGTGLTTVNTGDLLYGSAANTWGKLPAGTNGQFLTLASGIPSWATASAGSGWSLTGNTATAGSHFLGPVNNVSLRMRTNNTERMVIDSSGHVGIGSTSFDALQPEKLLVDGGTSATNNLIGAYADVNNYVQIGVQNHNSGNSASSDLVATADNGTNTTNYIDLGINSSGYANNASNILNRPNVGYLYTNATADFFIGNGATNQDMIFFTNNGSVGNTTANGNEAIRIDEGGNVGIGGTSRNNSGIKTTNAEKLVVQGNIIPRVSGSGTIGTSTYKWNAVYATNGTIQTSDRRMKTNILDLKYGLKEVLAMRPVSFNWKSSPDSNNKVGLIAQEVREIVPEVVTGNEIKETLGLNYAELVPVLINAVKEQQKEIEDLKKMVEKLTQKKQ